MNVYQFSENWHKDGKEPSLCFFLRKEPNVREIVRLTFPTWQNLALQNLLRYVEHQNVKGRFNKFDVLKILQNPEKRHPESYLMKEGSDYREIPKQIYDYLIDKCLAFDREPKQKNLTWIDYSRYISTEDVYDNPYNGNEHFYFSDFYPVTDIVQKQPEPTKQLLEHLENCKCGCKLHVRMSDLGYTTLHCMNPYCPVKLPFVLADIARTLGIVGIGSIVFEATVWRIFCENIKKHGTPTVCLREVLNENYFLQFNGATGDKMQEFWEKLNEFSGPLSDLVKLSSLPYVGEIASDVYTPRIVEAPPATFQEFYMQIKGGKVKSLRVAFILWLYLADIKHLLKCTKTKLKDADTVVYIAITGSVSFVQEDGEIVKFKNKQAYIDALNEALKNHGMDNDFRFALKKSLSSKCLCLINDSSSGSGKNNYAQELGIPVIKSNEIFNLIREVYYE